MKSFSNYVLNEIGDSYRPMPYTLDLQDTTTGLFANVTFRVDGAKYYASMHYWYNIDTSPSVAFATADGGTEVTDFGLKVAFQVIATVMAATKEYLHRLYAEFGIKVPAIRFTSASEAKIGKRDDPRKAKQREQLYLAFVKKQYPGSKVTKHNRMGESEVVVSIPPSFYNGIS